MATTEEVPMTDSFAEKYRKDLEFIKRMFDSAQTVETFATVARAANKLACEVAGLPTELKEQQKQLTMKVYPETTVTVCNLDKQWPWSKIKEELVNLGILVTHVEKAPGWDAAIVQVSSIASKEEALKLSGKEIEGRAIEVQDGPPTKHQMAELRRANIEAKSGNKRSGEPQGRGRGRGAKRGRR